jgi:putative DNA primase/helicase
MKIDWAKLYAAHTSNVAVPWTGMLPYLGECLGLSDGSLSALGVGFAPLVPFKKRVSPAWWVIPERDAEARIVGLSLRAEDGTKVMYPGSKHGLIYAVRPGYKTGTKDYTPGKHNWVRTMDAGVLCPVCGKPDGCLLSAENPQDPKAVLCIREKKGSTRPGNMDTGGFLHIRKAEGHIVKGGPLAESELPVIIVEGMTDTAAAMDLGFPAVGRPSNLAGLGMLRELVKGRSVFVIGENDVKADGRHPGKEGMEAVFETLKNCCKIKKFLPPETVKDLREWCRTGLTAELLIQHAEHYGSDMGDARHLESTEPVKVATRWLKEEHTQDGVPILRKYEQDWYRYNGQRYERIDEEAYIRGGLYRWLLDRLYRQEGKDGSVELVPYEADRSKVTNIIDALNMDCPLQAEPPCWLDGRTDPDPKNLLAFPNGVLDVSAYLADGTVNLMELSPLFFTFNAFPYDFNPQAECPIWRKFLGEALPGDPKKTMLLQEWAGLLLVPDTSFQKFMVLNGVSGSGKSTALFGLEAMLGSHQVCHPSLSGLGQQYGLAQFIGKLAAFVGDAELDAGANKRVIMERLKELTGSVHPMLEVRRMHIAETTMHVFARVTIACNDLPDLPDSGGALPRRTLAIHFTEKFDTDGKQPDRQLPDKIAGEAPGILIWALEGLARLRQRGGFTIPASSEALAKKFATNASPISQFVESCCDVGSHAAAHEDVLYEVWKNWAREHGLSGGMRLKFQHNLMLTVSSVRFVTDVKDGKKLGRYMGIAPTKDAKDRYLAR